MAPTTSTISPLLSNVRRTHDFEPLTVEGTIPASLRGTFYKTGPGVFERFGQRVNHSFEADGLMSAVRFTDIGAFGAVKIVESAGYREEEKAGKFLYNSNASWLSRMRAAKNGIAKTTGNTSMFTYNDKLFALMEAGRLQEIDPETLETLEASDLGVVKSGFSAHPHRVSALNTTFNFGVRYGKDMLLDLYALPDTGVAKQIGCLKAPWRGMVHDFMATEKHLIFLLGPAELVLWRALLGLTDLGKLFRWKPELGAQLWVVPLSEPSKPQVFGLDAIWAWHFAGAWDTEDGVIVDVAAYPNFDSISAIAMEQDLVDLPALTRFQTKNQSISKTTIHDTPMDFPTRHPITDGRRYRHLYGATTDGLMHLDLKTETEQRWKSPGGLEGSEPLVVARSEAEDDAHILALIYDDSRSQSGVSIFDASHLADGPVATVWFGQPIPTTFHGTFKTMA